MTQTILAGLVAGYGLAVPVGAVAVLMVTMTARTSFRMGAAAAMGAVTADGLYTVAAVLGGRALARTIEPFATPLTWIAALILLAMAIRIVRTATTAKGTASRALTPTSAWRSYLVFLGLTALNPWPAIYFAALILGRHAQGGLSGTETVAYVSAILLASTSWQLLLAAGGSALARTLTSPRSQKLTSVTSGALIGGLAISMLATG
ncbi:MAG: LysE/ArgO family amino acid transporter [Nocardioidaceae bacterium]